MNRRSHLIVSFNLSLTIAASTLSHDARAQAAAQSEATRQEAHERFDRGLRLFNQGDNAGALAEFKKAYELVEHPLVLYNVGLVHVAMRNPVDAVDAFDRLLANPGSLDAERLTNAQARRAEQAALIGEIQIAANVEGAEVELDNLPVARTPVSAPLRVASGQHLVAIVAPGYLPARREITVAGKSRVRAEFTLVPLEGRLAHVSVTANVPDAQVLLDGNLVGKTPLPTPLAVAPGAHEIEVRRPGYHPVKRSLNAGEGTTGQVDAALVPDPAALQSEGGLLALGFSEPDAVVFIDGQPRGPYGGPIQLPHGRHRLRVERADFFPFERDVTIGRGARESVSVDLLPTPEKRAAYRSTAVAQRTWAWIAVGTGAALATGGTVFLLWNQGQKNEKEDAYDSAIQRYSDDGECRLSRDEDERRAAGCTQGTAEVEIRLDSLDSARDRDVWGWVGVGVGAASLGAGIVLHLIRDDPERYEPRAESDVFARAEWTPGLWADSQGAGLGMSGRF